MENIAIGYKLLGTSVLIDYGRVTKEIELNTCDSCDEDCGECEDGWVSPQEFRLHYTFWWGGFSIREIRMVYHQEILTKGRIRYDTNSSVLTSRPLHK